MLGIGITDISGEVYFSGNAYLTYNVGRNVLAGLENSLTVTFTYCNNKGILLYKDDSVGFFALGVHSRRIYLEWKTTSEVVEVYLFKDNRILLKLENLKQLKKSVPFLLIH